MELRIQPGLAQLMFHRVQLRWDGGVLADTCWPALWSA